MTESVTIPDTIRARITQAAMENRDALDDLLVEFLEWAQASNGCQLEYGQWNQLSHDSLVSPDQVSKRLLLSKSKLAKLRCSGKGPRYVKLGARTVAYRVEDVDTYIHENLQLSTSEQ